MDRKTGRWKDGKMDRRTNWQKDKQKGKLKTKGIQDCEISATMTKKIMRCRDDE